MDPNDTLTIVRGIGNYPPLEMVENGRLTGLHIEMIRHVAYQLGIDLEFESLPWARAIKHFSAGKSDAISYFGYTKEREGFSLYHEGNVLSNTRWVFLALEERKHEFSFDRSLVGLENLIIGVQHGYSHGKYFDSMKHLKRDVVTNEFDIEVMLKRKRHDLSMMSYEEFLGFKERGDFKGIVALSPFIDIDPQYLAFSRTKNDDGRLKKLSELFAKEFKRFKTSDDYFNLLEKYGFHVE
jgi:polar amino acid transport system substrate-binding protein